MVVPGQTVTRYYRADRSFDTARTAEYRLAIQAGIHAFRIAVLDEKGSRCIVLGEFGNTTATASASLTDQTKSFNTFLDGVLEAVPWLIQPFGKRWLTWTGPSSTLVPARLAVREEMWQYLAFGYKLEAGETVLSDRLENLDAYNVYSIPEKIRELLSLRFALTDLSHHTTPFIAGSMADFSHRPGRPILYSWISDSSVNLALVGNGGLLIHNRFAFSAPEDVIYYVIYILQQFAVEPQHARVILTGDVTSSGLLWTLLGKYVGEPLILPGIQGIHPARDLEEAPIHQWFIPLNLPICGS
jgi:hypothetical protein